MSQVESTLQFTNESYMISEFKEKFHAPKIEVLKHEKDDGAITHSFKAGAQRGLVSKKVIEGDKRTKLITRVMNDEGELIWMLHPEGTSGEVVLEL